MSGLIFLFVLAAHIAFGMNGFYHFHIGVVTAQTWRQTIHFGGFTAIAFTVTAAMYLYFMKISISSNELADFSFLAKVGFGLPVLILATAFFVIPFVFRQSENGYRIAKAGIGLAIPATTIFMLIYAQDFARALTAK